MIRLVLIRQAAESTVADFEGEKSIETHLATHQASITCVSDVPKGVGKIAARTDIE